MGCFTVLFSHAGTMLAAACADRDAFPVVGRRRLVCAKPRVCEASGCVTPQRKTSVSAHLIYSSTVSVYEIPSGRVLAAFSGHLKIVYDLCWSRDDQRLLSASSDGTVRSVVCVVLLQLFVCVCLIVLSLMVVREWNVERLLGTAQKVLPHPSFVYCAQYHPAAQNLALTGGFDALLRVWRVDVDDVNGQLLQEFDGHGSFINTICFDSEGTRFVTLLELKPARRQ